MLVHDHRPHPSVLERRATIIQAKVFGPSGMAKQNQNQIQLDLYQMWPRFTYKNWPGGMTELTTMHSKNTGITLSTPGALERDVFVSKPHPPRASHAVVDTGARYGMIDTTRNPWPTPGYSRNPWRLCSPNVGNLYQHKGGMTLAAIS